MGARRFGKGTTYTTVYRGFKLEVHARGKRHYGYILTTRGATHWVPFVPTAFHGKSTKEVVLRMQKTADELLGERR